MLDSLPPTRRSSLADATARRRQLQLETLRTQFAQADGLAFAEVLPVSRLESALDEEGATCREARPRGTAGSPGS